MTEKRFEISLIDNREYKLNDYVNHEIEIGKSEKLMYIMNDKLNALHEENMRLKWILQNYNPQDLNVPLDKEELKRFIELLYSTKMVKE